MVPKILVTFATLTYGLAVPILEINATHVFNPDWPAHARLHEVWQLATNSAFAVLALWLVWARGRIGPPVAIGLLVTGGFFFAYAIQDLYGGSMKYVDGSEKTALGINVGVLGFGLAVTALATAAIATHRR